MNAPWSRNERGIALIVVMLMTVAVAAIAAGAIFLTANTTVISKGHEREEDMRNAADAGIELGRSALNGDPALFPDSNYVAMAVNQPVYDASGNLIPNVTRSIYYGPTGSATGQYGIFGSVVSVIQDASGAVVVRRGELAQESFAKFAYFTDDEGSGICFGSGDNIFGPVHTNDDMCINSLGARFRSTVTVAGVINGVQYGTFDQGYQIGASVIPLPSLAQLAKLNTYATTGGMSYTAPVGGTSAQARMRIEFVALDLDSNGRVTDPDEGFYRIYVDTGVANPWYVTANRIARPDTSSVCGHFHGQVFYTARMHTTSFTPPGGGTIWAVPWINAPAATHQGGAGAPSQAAGEQALANTAGGPLRCFLGGHDRLNITNAAGGTVPRNTFTAADRFGAWARFTNTPDPRIVLALRNPASAAVDTVQAARDSLAKYLFPLSRAYNPNTKGVIYVTGKVVLSGVLNARLTVASDDNIILADDLRYATAPGSAPCVSSNMLGLLSPDTIFMADNTINAPWDWTQGAGNGGTTFKSYDDTDEETLHAVILSLLAYYGQNHGSGNNNLQPCQTTVRGRGCLQLTGGVIQDTRGAIGTSGGTGWNKRYAYDICAFQTPPPYFPTTGRFLRNRYYEIDPVGFNVATFFASLAPTP